MHVQNAGTEPDLRQLGQVLRRRKWRVVTATLLGLGCGLAYSAILPPTYTSDAQVLLQSSSAANLITGAQPSGLSSTDIQTQADLATSAPVVAAVRNKLGAAPKISVTEVSTTNILQFQASSNSPSTAAKVANAYANAYVAVRRGDAVSSYLAAASQVQAKINSLQSQLNSLGGASASSPQAGALSAQVATFRQQLAELQLGATTASASAQLANPATPPHSPSSPHPLRDTAAGVGIGLFLGVALAFLYEYLDDTVKSKDDLETCLGGVPVLGLVPTVRKWKPKDKPRLITVESPSSPIAESYRSVRTAVQFVSLDSPLRTLQVTSPASTEGKTTTVANLAVALAQGGDRVVIVCCDLRRPRVHQFFGLDNSVGFTSVILGEASLRQALQVVPGQPRLALLASGPLPPQPAELLGSERAYEVLNSLKGVADVVLLDSPPVLPVTDAAVLSRHVDATLLVAKAGNTTRGQIARAVEILTQVGAPLIGAVLNGVAQENAYAESYYRYSYGGPEAKALKNMMRWTGGDRQPATAQNGSDRQEVPAD